MKIKKVLHITGVRELGSGQRTQLKYENNAANNISNFRWDTIAIHSKSPVESFELQTPFYLDFLLLRNIYFWLFLLKESKKYDFVLFRHIPFDPFSIVFSPFIKNRISVHHTKEIEELLIVKPGLKGYLASKLEKLTGKVSLNNSAFIAAVTQEIADYESSRINTTQNTLIYPNGMETGSIIIADDERYTDSVHALFMCSYFSEWHGLDLIINEIKNSNVNYPYYIHLIGNLTEEQEKIISQLNTENIVVHGSLSTKEYFKIASKCDIGIGSLALFRKNLNEASTLKVREMLAMGLPVYSGHKDSAFAEDYQFYYCTKNFNLQEMITYALNHRTTSRDKIRSSACQLIEKKNIMTNFIEQIEYLTSKNMHS